MREQMQRIKETVRVAFTWNHYDGVDRVPDYHELDETCFGVQDTKVPGPERFQVIEETDFDGDDEMMTTHRSFPTLDAAKQHAVVLWRRSDRRNQRYGY